MGCGVIDGVIDAAKNNTNSTDELSSISEDKVLSIYRGGAAVYAAKDLLRDLVIGASPGLLINNK